MRDAADPLIRQYLDAGAPTGERATQPAITHWLRKWLRATANDLAVSWLAEQDAQGAPDFVALGPSICKRMGWPAQLGNVAVLAEYRDAKERAVQFLGAVTPVVRRLAYDRAPGDQMISTVQKIAYEQRLYIPQDYIVALCRRIAATTLGTGRGRGTGG